MSDKEAFDQLTINMMGLYTAGKYAAALELVEPTLILSEIHCTP